jgi:hypothetical protein
MRSDTKGKPGDTNTSGEFGHAHADGVPAVVHPVTKDKLQSLAKKIPSFTLRTGHVSQGT